MANQTAVLERIAKPKCVAEEISGSLIIDCMHAIPLSRGVYCAIQRRKVDEDACNGCPDFSHEPTEYRLFRRE
jgi:hypothetical protein